VAFRSFAAGKPVEGSAPLRARDRGSAAATICERKELSKGADVGGDRQRVAVLYPDANRRGLGRNANARVRALRTPFGASRRWSSGASST